MTYEPVPRLDPVVGVVASAAQHVVVPSDAKPVHSQAVRTISAALVGSDVEQAELATACRILAGDPYGPERLDAMVNRATSAMVVPTDYPGETVPIERASTIAAVHATYLRAVIDHGNDSDLSYEKFAALVAHITEAGDFDEACSRIAAGLVQLTGLSCGGVYVSADEHARMTRAAWYNNSADASADDASDQQPAIEPPVALRIDRGLFADVIAGDRPAFVSRAEPIDELTRSQAPARTAIAVPMRDAIGRPVGLLIALDSGQHRMNVAVVESVRRLAAVVSGQLAFATGSQRSRTAIGALPELAKLAHDEAGGMADQLESLARIIVSATQSDSAVIRMRDSSGHVLETAAIYSQQGEATADIIGTRTMLVEGAVTTHGAHPLRSDIDPIEIGVTQHDFVGIEDAPDSWSRAGKRILRELSARTVSCVPIVSRYGRHGVLYVVRASARPFDDVDTSCIRIGTAHVQHVIDRHISRQQTSRAVDAAQNAVRLLGEALVAGVRSDRTLRFIPRLFHEMFSCRAVQIWRKHDDDDASVIAGSRVLEADVPSQALQQAWGEPLLLEMDQVDDRRIAAVAFDEFGGGRVGIEFELDHERSLGVEEQRLAIDVASRIQEALWSAGQAAAYEQQLDSVRRLQDVVTLAHEQQSEQQIIDIVVEHTRTLFGWSGAAFFFVDSANNIECLAADGVAQDVITALANTRVWAADAAQGDQAAITAITSIGSDERVAERIRDACKQSGYGDHSAVIVPVTGREQTLGVLLMVFADGIPDEMAAEARSRDGMFATFGSHIGGSLLRARAFERERMMRLRTEQLLDSERENARQTRALHEVSRAFANSLSYEETMRAVVEAMADRLDIDAVWIRTQDERGDSMMLRAFHATYPELRGALSRMVSPPEPRDDVLTTEVIQSKRSVLVSDPSSDQWSGSVVITRLQPFLQQGSSLAVLPLMRPGGAEENVMGTVTLLSIDPSSVLTADKVDIASSVTDQAALALDNARLYEQQKSFAEIIQESLLPGKLPDISSIDYGVLYRSAVVGGDAPQIGGDFYDFLELEDGRLAMALGDVTGKGVQAAADTAMTKYVFRSLAREHPSPASFLRYANEVVCDEISAGKFVTLFYAVIDPVNEVITCGKAGHPEPKLLYPGGTKLPSGERIDDDDSQIVSLEMEGLALGILQDQDYEQREYPFPPGSSLIVYTDGVVEARNEGRLYGQFRLERRIHEEAGGGAGQIAYSIYEDCHAYAEHGLNDDVAIVVVRNMPDDQ